MQVGLSVIFQNPDETVPDQQVYQQDLSLALQAEGLGFDSVWSVEHLFTVYSMCPDVLQFLTYMAGATKKIKLGSMVCVLPWHCLLYTSPSPRDGLLSRMPSSA